MTCFWNLLVILRQTMPCTVSLVGGWIWRSCLFRSRFIKPRAKVMEFNVLHQRRTIGMN